MPEITEQPLKIIDKESRSESIFEEYRDEADIGNEMIKELMKRFKRCRKSKDKDSEIKDGDWFYLSDNNPKTGILSICPGLSTLFNIERGLMSDNKDINKDILINYEDQIHRMIQYIVTSVKKGDAYHFGATPFINEGEVFDEKTPYLGSVLWILSTLLHVWRLAYLGKITLRIVEDICYDGKLPEITDADAKKRQHEEQLANVESIILECISIIDRSFITGEGDKKESGWNYTIPPLVENEAKSKTDQKKKMKRSLYFTYKVSEAWLDIVIAFGDTFARNREIERRIKTIGEGKLADTDYWKSAKVRKDISEKDEKNYRKTHSNEKEINEYMGFWSKVRENAAIDEKLNGFIIGDENRGVNKGKRIFDPESVISRLKENLLGIGGELWSRFGEHMSDKVFYSDGGEGEKDVIMKGDPNGILFNTLFIQGIILNSAYDEKLKDEDNNIGEYLNLYDKMQQTIQSVLDLYNSAKKNGKLYKIERYVLLFDEFEESGRGIEELRRSKILGFTLLPFLIKINNLLSKYVVKYPQKQMRTFLELILSNSCYEDKEEKDENGEMVTIRKRIWLWESNGYNGLSNYYYAEALTNFYEYYNKYEAVFLDNVEKTRKANYETFQSEKAILDVELKQTKEKLDEANIALNEREGTITTLNLDLEKERKNEMLEALGNFVDNRNKEASRQQTLENVADAFEGAWQENIVKKKYFKDDENTDIKEIEEGEKALTVKISALLLDVFLYNYSAKIKKAVNDSTFPGLNQRDETERIALANVYLKNKIEKWLDAQLESLKDECNKPEFSVKNNKTAIDEFNNKVTSDIDLKIGKKYVMDNKNRGGN